MSTDLDIQAEWLPINLHKIADDISRLSNKNGNYDYSQLFIDHPLLNNCCQFQPPQTLLRMIWDVLQNKCLPDPLMLRQLELAALGSTIL